MKFIKKFVAYISLNLFLVSSPSFAEKHDPKYNQDRFPAIIAAPAAISAAKTTIAATIGIGTGVAIKEHLSKKKNDKPKGGHDSNIRPSSKGKHEKGDARREKEQGGDKKRKHIRWKPNKNKRK